jgi:hypothetical protein
MLSAQKLLSVAALGLFAFCGKSKEVPPINPTKVFTQVEAAITTTYFSGDPAPPLEKLYGNAVAALDAKETPDMKGTIKAIESQGPDKVRERTYRALNAFLSELPGGNDFTRAEGLLMSEDKSRQAGIGILLMQEGPGKRAQLGPPVLKTWTLRKWPVEFAARKAQMYDLDFSEANPPSNVQN